MSAWYVLSAMGFYSFCPGTNEYLIGSPIFDKVTITNGNGKKFIIKAENVSPYNIYSQSATLNGKRYSKNYFLHSDLTNGSEIVFEMEKNPDKKLGKGSNNIPYSFSKKDFASPPYQKKDIPLFKKSAIVDLACRLQGSVIYYTLDGTEPDEKSNKFSKPFTIYKTTNIKARSYKEGLDPSNVISFTSEKLTYQAGEHPQNLVNGVKYFYYEGVFSSVFDFVKLNPIKSGVINYLNFTPAQVEDHYGFKYECYIKVPKDGIYKFYTKSDDGSVLYVGDKLVVANDGRHVPMVSSGSVALKAGLHLMKVLFFEDKSGQELEVEYECPGVDKQIVPENILYYTKN